MHHADEEGGEPNYWHLFARVVDWYPGRLDHLIRLISQEKMANVLLVDPYYQWLLHPYDGGVDVIAESTQARDVLRKTYRTWLSARADGM